MVVAGSQSFLCTKNSHTVGGAKMTAVHTGISQTRIPYDGVPWFMAVAMVAQAWGTWMIIRYLDISRCFIFLAEFNPVRSVQHFVFLLPNGSM